MARLFNMQVYGDVIMGTAAVYTDPRFDETLASADALVVQAIADAAGGVPSRRAPSRGRAASSSIGHDLRSWGTSLLALTSRGNVYCWGLGYYYGCQGLGYLGYPFVATHLESLQCIEKLTGDGRFAIDVEGRLWAWGTEFIEELGNGPSQESPAAVARVLLEPKALSVTVSRETALADTDDGLWSWGPIWNTRTWDDPAGYVPSRYEGPTALLNEILVCDIDEDGTARCMGSNEFGQNGDGTTEPTFELTPLAVDERFSRLWHHSGTFGLTEDGRLFAWGLNSGSPRV